MPCIWSILILTMLGGTNNPCTIGTGLRLDTHPPTPPPPPPTAAAPQPLVAGWDQAVVPHAIIRRR